MNISGVVIKTLTENAGSLLKDLGSSGLCDVHFHDELGKIIITIEGESISEEMEKLKVIQNMPHVISASLAYSYNEGELSDAEHLFENKGDAVPDALKE